MRGQVVLKKKSFQAVITKHTGNANAQRLIDQSDIFGGTGIAMR